MSKVVHHAKAALQVVRAVSRKTHGTSGDFDVDLPLTPPFGIESRGATGTHTIVVLFSAELTNANATVAETGAYVANSRVSGNTLTIDVANVPDGKPITLSLSSVIDSFGRSLPETKITMQTLIGDVTANGVVNVSDIGAAKSQIGQSITESNFRFDVNGDGQIDAFDIALIKAQSGNSLPAFESDRPRPGKNVLSSHTQFLSFTGPSAVGVGGTFTISTNLSFNGYSAFGLSYWLEVEDVVARFVTIADARYFTFLDPTQTNIAPFNSTFGASPGFKSASRDLGATVPAVPDDNVPAGAHHVTDVLISVSNDAPPGTYTLRSTVLLPRKSEVSDTNFSDNYIQTAGTFTFRITPKPPRPEPTASASPRPTATPKPSDPPGPSPTPRPSSTPK